MAEKEVLEAKERRTKEEQIALDFIYSEISRIKGKGPAKPTVPQSLDSQLGTESFQVRSDGASTSRSAAAGAAAQVAEEAGSVLPSNGEGLPKKISSVADSAVEKAASTGGMARKLILGIVAGILGFAGLAALLTYFLRKKE